jgi:hypothetical protein
MTSWVRRGSRNVLFLLGIRIFKVHGETMLHHWVRRRESHPNFQGHNLASCLLDDDRHEIFVTLQQEIGSGFAARPKGKILVSNRLLDGPEMKPCQVMGEIRIGLETSSTNTVLTFSAFTIAI